MERKQKAIISAMAAAAVLWSCDVIEKPSTVPQEKGDEIVLEVDEQTFATNTKAQDGEDEAIQILIDDDITMEMEAVPYGADSVQTKATALTSIPSSLYWEGTTGSWKSETARWASASASISSGRLSTGKYQTGTATAYNYYVSNKAITFAPGGSTISASNGTDVIAGCTQGATSSTTPAVSLAHVFARTGAITLNTQQGFALSGVSWKIESTPGSGGTAGTYNIATGEWSGVTALPQTALDSGSDLYLVPGTYRLTVSYTLSAAGRSLPFTKSCDVTLTAGKVHSITATATGGTIAHELVVTPSGTSVYIGRTTSLKAVYHTVVNGVRDQGTDVTSSAAWSTSAPGVATVSRGTVTGKAAGSATITASYGGESAGAEVRVESPYTVTLAGGSSYWIENNIMLGNASTFYYYGHTMISVRMTDAATGTEKDVTPQCTFTKTSGEDVFDISPSGMITSELDPRYYLETPQPGEGDMVTFGGTARIDYTDPSGKAWSWDISVDVYLTIDNETEYF